MTEKDAYRILGLMPGITLHELKKKYRELMMQVHPDSGIHAAQQMPSPKLPFMQKECACTAQEINRAYSILKEKLSSSARTEPRQTVNCQTKEPHPNHRQPSVWNAPVNEHAYTEREILQYAEESDGTVYGNFCAAKGKYLWTTEEDFSLFLLSMYQCSKRLLDKAETSLNREHTPAVRRQFQTELTYLLAQQFIAGTNLLKELAKEERADLDGNRIFYIQAMLEMPDKAVPRKTGETLYPSKIRQHKLYLKDNAGRESGYLSFADDRLYYVVIPLFEQKRVKVKIQTAEKQPRKASAVNYQNLDLWLKLCDKNQNGMPESLNMQIGQLLRQYQSL
ncbi:MAG: J domain-containing protein [Lachnospiraceae bacterium]|nr:J domain-containing protein [Lachnospiraceae bacterium]